MIVRELLTKLGFKTDTAALNKYSQATDKFKANADSAANSFRNMFVAFAGFQGIQALANTADTVQSLEARIGMLPQTLGETGDAFDAIAKRASNAKQSLEGYATFYIKAGNATQDFIKNQSDLLNIVDGAAMGLAASGATAVSQGQAFFQLGQAIGSPTVQMEEMNTLIDVAPDLFRELGKAIPGANGNLKKFISTGEVTGKMLAEGLIKVLPIFEERMKKMPMTIGTATLLISNRWQTFIARMNRESGAVTKIANVFMSMFDGIESGINKVIKFFGGATNTLKFFGIVLAAVLAPMALNAFIGLVAFLISPLGLVIIALTAIGLLIEDIYQWATGGKSIMGALFGDFDYFMMRINGIVEYVKGLFEVIFGILTLDIDMIAGGFKRMFNGLVESLFSLTLAITDAFENGFKNVDFASFFTKMGESLYQSLMNALAKFFKFNFDLIGLSVPNAVSPAKVASGSGANTSSATTNVTVNQTLPSGTSEQTAKAASDATKRAIYDNIILQRASRQAGQAQ